MCDAGGASTLMIGPSPPAPAGVRWSMGLCDRQKAAVGDERVVGHVGEGTASGFRSQATESACSAEGLAAMRGLMAGMAARLPSPIAEPARAARHQHQGGSCGQPGENPIPRIP
jgi:hypothetical protein